METVREFYYFGDRVNAGGECEATLTARTRYGWVKSRECGEFLYGMRCHLNVKWAIYKSCEASYTISNSSMVPVGEMEILCRMERSMVKAMCGVQLIERKGSTDLMFMLGLSETLDQFAIANSVEERGWSCLENGIRF